MTLSGETPCNIFFVQILPIDMPPLDKATSSVSSCIGTFFVGMKVVPFCFILGNGVGDTKSPVKIRCIKMYITFAYLYFVYSI